MCSGRPRVNPARRPRSARPHRVARVTHRSIGIASRRRRRRRVRRDDGPSPRLPSVSAAGGRARTATGSGPSGVPQRCRCTRPPATRGSRRSGHRHRCAGRRSPAATSTGNRSTRHRRCRRRLQRASTPVGRGVVDAVNAMSISTAPPNTRRRRRRRRRSPKERSVVSPPATHVSSTSLIATTWSPALPVPIAPVRSPICCPQKFEHML